MFRTLPRFLRVFLRDAVEGALTAILAVTLAMPPSVDEARAQALVIWAAVIGAVIAAGRRQVPVAIGWVLDRLGLGEGS